MLMIQIKHKKKWASSVSFSEEQKFTENDIKRNYELCSQDWAVKEYYYEINLRYKNQQCANDSESWLGTNIFGHLPFYNKKKTHDTLF